MLPRASEGLYLLQRVRDEAHRFAITYHRQKRSKRMTVSALDDVPGLGEVRRKALLKQFGSLKRLKAASVDEISTVPGIGRRTAEAILVALKGGEGADVGAAEGVDVADVGAAEGADVEDVNVVDVVEGADAGTAENSPTEDVADAEPATPAP